MLGAMPSKKLILHIGSNKTGSSSIQQFLARNRKRLARRGISFPTAGATVYGNHSRMARDLQRYCSGVSPGAEAWDEFVIEARTTSSHMVVVSGEAFWTFGPNGEPFQLLTESVRDLFDEVNILCYLRRQDEYLRSCYVQGLRSGRTAENFEDYVESAVNGDRRWSFDYADRLAHWAEQFGADHLVIRPFEKAQMHGDGLVADFASACGIETGRLKTRLRDKNVSPGRRVMAGMAYAQTMLPKIKGTGGQAGWLSSMCSNMSDELSARWKDEKFVGFGPGQARRFCDSFAAGNEAVARTYLGREDGRLFLSDTYRESEKQPEIVLTQKERREVERRAGKIRKLMAKTWG